MANGYIYAIYFYKDVFFSKNETYCDVIMRQLYRNNCAYINEVCMAFDSDEQIFFEIDRSSLPF